MASELKGKGVYLPGEGFWKFITSGYLGFYPSKGLMYFLLFITLGGMAFLVVEESLIGAALAGGLAESINTTPEIMSWVLGSLSIGAVLGYPLAGPLADKIGRRKLILWGLIGYVIADIFQMLCLNVWSFTLARAWSGAVGMFTIVPALAIVRDLTPRLNRGMGYGIAAGCGWGGGGLLSFLLGGIALQMYAGKSLFGMTGDWRGIFYLAGIIALVVFFIELLFLKDLHPVLRLRERGLDLESDVKLEDIKESDLEGKGSVLEAIKMYFKSWRMWFIWSNQWFMGIPWTAVLTFMPLMLVDISKISAAQASYMSAFLYVGYICGGLFAGWYIDRYHARRIVNAAGNFLLFLTMAYFAAIAAKGGASLVQMYAVLIIGGIGVGSTFPPYATVLAGESERQNPSGVASAFAFYITSCSVVNFIPQFLFPRLYEASGSWVICLIIMGISALCAVPTLLIGGRGPFWPRHTLEERFVKEYY